MPNISKEKLDAINADLDALKTAYDAERDDRKILIRKEANFNKILEKIINASHGMPLNSSRTQNHTYDNGYTTLSEHQCQPPTEEQLLRKENGLLQDQIRYLEMKLAAVRAIAEFAQEHKA